MLVEGSGWTSYEDTESYTEAKALAASLNKGVNQAYFRVWEDVL